MGQADRNMTSLGERVAELQDADAAWLAAQGRPTPSLRRSLPLVAAGGG